MAKASRSSKKQPDFDPSEIDDLIFSPAVGKGVGSHLVTPATPVGLATSHVSTVVIPDSPTVDSSNPALVLGTGELNNALGGKGPTTVVTSATSLDTGPASNVATVAMSPDLWITEHGDLVSAARVKRIRLAQDVINSAEESVYDTLWNARLVSADENGRLVQAGYDYLVKRTRLSRKTIQRIVAKLLEKDFIAVETRADIYQRTATIYRVFSYKAVLERNTKKGRLYVAKMGPGFSYARPLRASEVHSDLTTVVGSDATPMDIVRMATVDKPATVTVAKTDRPTVVKMSSYLLDARSIDISSSEGREVQTALAAYGRVDDDVVSQLVAACRSYAPDCTAEEITYFVHEKGKLVRRRDNRVQNPLGFLLTAVPKCFSGDLLREYRAARSREVEQCLDVPVPGSEDPALLRWRRDQEQALLDPGVSEQEKHLIRLCLGLNTQ